MTNMPDNNTGSLPFLSNRSNEQLLARIVALEERVISLVGVRAVPQVPSKASIYG